MSIYHYICHHCLDYITPSISDIGKHFKRLKKCKLSSPYSYDMAKLLSKKKYIINMDIKKLCKSDLLYITTHYVNEINTINEDFKKNTDNHNHNNIVEQNLIENDVSESDQFARSARIDVLKSKHSVRSLDRTKNDETKDLLLDNTYTLFQATSKTKNVPENVYYNKENGLYKCGYCNTEYTYLHNLKRHIQNTCAKRIEQNNKIDTTNKNIQNILKHILQKEEAKQAINNTFINNNNIQNIQNNNNNANNNTYHLDIKDFMHDRYDLSHIKDNFYEQKDFFLYHNFLRVIMENKKNQNIYFSSGEAIIYSDNELYKMNSEKAGYMILDKLSNSFDQLLYRQNEESQIFYEFVKKYYHVIKGHYKHDTIHKDYDVDEQKFVYTANSSLFRSRDKYLSKMITTLNKFKNSAHENMLINLDEINDIPMLNPSIEDFASTKMRYRDLKDKD